MSPLEHLPLRKVLADPKVPLFRSETRSIVVDETIVSPAGSTGLRGTDVKISEYRLERYLNPSNPTCSG